VLAGKGIICAVLAAFAAALPMAGCGGGGESSTSTTASGEPLTKQELIAKGDAICKQARTQFEQLQQNPPTTPQGAATLTQKLIDISETELSQLRDLNPPASLKSSLDDYVGALDKNIRVLKQGLKAAQQNDATGYAKAQAETVSEQVKRLQLARAVGFEECSRPAGTAPGSASGQ
jgi:hypothetical protein